MSKLKNLCEICIYNKICLLSQKKNYTTIKCTKWNKIKK